MAKILPYFKWFPADAESDSKYASMSFAEVGLYHRCLNYAWTNDGLPADVGELARVLRSSDKEVRRLWVRVRHCFVLLESENRVRNPRQEQEREEAKAKSMKSKVSAEARWSSATCERNADAYPNAMPRAYGSVSESFYEVLKKEKGFNFEVRFTDAWKRHQKHRGTESMQLVCQMLIDVDWDLFDATHVSFCAFWDRNDWTKCPVTMLEWWRNGMPGAPTETAKRPTGRKDDGLDEVFRELKEGKYD